jgi:hypothetical protein
MKYHIVIAGTAETLQVRVQELIDCGWRPQGGVSVSGVLWSQVMVLVA